MSFEEATDPRSLIAGSDLRTTGRYRCGVLANSNGDAVINVAGTQGIDVYGIIDDAVNTGEVCRVIKSGTAQVMAGAAITAGARVMTTAVGKVITATSANKVVGWARQAATADGDIIAVELDKLSDATP